MSEVKRYNVSDDTLNRDAWVVLAHDYDAAIRERDEYRHERIMLLEQRDDARADNARYEQQFNVAHAALDEARAELAKHAAALESHWKMWADCCIERDALRAAIEALQADMRVMWGWGDPCDMTVSDEVVWSKYHDPNGYGFRFPLPPATKEQP